jgi:hypothetical protein
MIHKMRLTSMPYSRMKIQKYMIAHKIYIKQILVDKTLKSKILGELLNHLLSNLKNINICLKSKIS